MGEQNYSIDTDLKEVQAMTAALVPYVYQEELYGKVGANLPRLTLGAVLLRLRRLQALRGQMNAGQAALVDQVVAQHDSVHSEWGTHYVKKCAQELTARTRDMMTYLKECREEKRLCASAYMPEALRRTMVEEILTVMPEADLQSSGLMMRVKEVDSGLRRNGRETDFIWTEVLRPIYPQQPFWWLYSRPPG
jgi:hypothetical protein